MKLRHMIAYVYTNKHLLSKTGKLSYKSSLKADLFVLLDRYVWESTFNFVCRSFLAHTGWQDIRHYIIMN